MVLIALTLALALGQEPARPSFAEWLTAVRAEAISRGVREEILDAALADVTEPQPVILERDRAQAETVFSLEKYIARILKPKLILGGRTALATHRELLDQISERYGVPSRIVVAIWGMESNYGRFSGVRPTVPALATLAWDPRRAAFFRGELFNALEILNRGDIDLPRLKGSWAGAMGQTQFMPSSYLKFAEDFDGDGKRDIWSTPADVFASIANYLKGHGWAADRELGARGQGHAGGARADCPRCRTTHRQCQATRDMTIPFPLSRWRSWACGSPAARPAQGRHARVAGVGRHPSLPGRGQLRRDCSNTTARTRTPITVALLAIDCIEQGAGGEIYESGGIQKEGRPLRVRGTHAGTVQLDDRGVIVECAACGKKNRVAYERLGDAVQCGECKQALRAPGEPIEIHQSADFDRLIAQSSLPVVVDYWAPWCGPCRMVAPELQKVAARQAGQAIVVKVNTDELSDLGQRFGIRSIPTLAVFEGGKEIARESGARPAPEIEAFIARARAAVPAR